MLFHVFERRLRLEAAEDFVHLLRIELEFVLRDAGLAHLEIGAADVGDELVECLDEIFARLGIGGAHGFRHLDHVFLGRFALGEEVIVGMRNHDEAGAMHELVMERAHRVLHRVRGRAHHVVARERVRIGHHLARFLVAAIGHGAGRYFATSSIVLSANISAIG